MSTDRHDDHTQSNEASSPSSDNDWTEANNRASAAGELRNNYLSTRSTVDRYYVGDSFFIARSAESIAESIPAEFSGPVAVGPRVGSGRTIARHFVPGHDTWSPRTARHLDFYDLMARPGRRIPSGNDVDDDSDSDTTGSMPSLDLRTEATSITLIAPTHARMPTRTS